MKYAAMLAEKMQQHGTHAWLVNTGRQQVIIGLSFAAQPHQ
jgi:ATP-dependent phosphoenolpyruvate carboxykinase